MAVLKSQKTRRAHGSSKKSSDGLASLHSSSQDTTQRYLRSTKTQETYGGNVKRGKIWLVEETSREQPKVFDEKDRVGDSVPWKDDSFARSFDTNPVWCSPDALAMYIAFKCLEQGCSYSTAEGIYAAFKAYWNSILYV